MGRIVSSNRIDRNRTEARTPLPHPAIHSDGRDARPLASQPASAGRATLACRAVEVANGH
jgi:hypothetical protein